LFAGSCEEVDVVSVYVMMDDVRREIGSYCGSKRPLPLMSANSHMQLEFISRTLPDAKNYRGFNISFRFVKGADRDGYRINGWGTLIKSATAEGKSTIGRTTDS